MPVRANAAAAATVVGASVLALGGAQGTSTHRGGELRLVHDTAAPRHARWTVTADLRDRGVGEDALAEVAVVLSELVANAVCHAHPLTDGTVRVRWQHADGDVHMQVTDGCRPGHRWTVPTGPAESPVDGADLGVVAGLQDLAELATGGRGLRIVASLADDWGRARDHGGGCTVWAVLAA